MVGALCACSPNVETRGHLKDPDWQTRIIPSKTTQDEVLAILGSPSARTSFGPDVWYYITTQKENVAFFKPEVAEQDVLVIGFKSDGTVGYTETIGRDKARDIYVSGRITPTEGHQMTFMEQLLGNVGRFNQPGGMGSPSSSRRGGGRPY
jgi:outer membrane protein assembly factor BamE (lipoprotein component of BamABCDE complex)